MGEPEALAQRDPVLPGESCRARYRPDAATLRLDDGRSLRAALVIGADGRDSWVREHAGMAATVTPYGERGVVANFVCERPNRGIAYQWFRPDGVLAWLPLPGRGMSMVWAAPDALASERASASSRRRPS